MRGMKIRRLAIKAKELSGYLVGNLVLSCEEWLQDMITGSTCNVD